MSKLRIKKEQLLLLGTLIGGFFLLMILSYIHINQGSAAVSSKTIIEAIFSPQNITEHHLVRYLRLPRLTIALLVGGMLGVSGVLFQTIMKNPLASDSTLGINAGAYFVVVLLAAFIPKGVVGLAFFPALFGALATAFIVYALGGRSKSNPVHMALAGTAISLVLYSMTAALQILYEKETSGLFLWGSGSLMQGSWVGVQFALPILIPAFIICFVISSRLDVMSLGDDIASSLGLNVVFYRYFGLLLGGVISATVVSVVGPIGFVGLVAPHIIKRLGFNKHHHLILLSFIYGGIILVGADVMARFFTRSSHELPVGAFTALVGAPWLIYLAYKTMKNMAQSSSGSMVTSKYKKLPYYLVILLAIVILIFAFLISLRYGGVEYSFGEIIKILAGHGDKVASTIIVNIRMPRVLTAILAGMVLGISGFLLQTILKNPLADPSILGVTPGAALGALICLSFFPTVGSSIVTISAFLGALLAAFMIFLVARKSLYNPVVLVLVGMAATALGSAGVNIIVVNTIVGKAASLVWLAGSTYSSTWNNVTTLIIAIITLFPIAWLLCKDLDAVILGDEVATGIGCHVNKIRLLTSFIGILLAAIAVATVGTVGFIGLLAPHISRMLIGVKHRKAIVLTGLMGGIMLLAADFIGRTFIYPNEIPSGLVVAVIGGPYFLWLMYSTKRVRR